MDVEIGEMENVVQVTDRQSLLDPAALEQIISLVLSRIKDVQAQDHHASKDRNYTKSITGGR